MECNKLLERTALNGCVMVEKACRYPLAAGLLFAVWLIGDGDGGADFLGGRIIAAATGELYAAAVQSWAAFLTSLRPFDLKTLSR